MYDETTLSAALAVVTVEKVRAEVGRKRAYLLAGRWHEEARISALTDEQVVAEYEAYEADEAGFKGEDWETLDETQGVIDGLEIALDALRKLLPQGTPGTLEEAQAVNAAAEGEAG